MPNRSRHSELDAQEPASWIKLAEVLVGQIPDLESEEQVSIWYLLGRKLLARRVSAAVTARWFGVQKADRTRLDPLLKFLPELAVNSLEDLSLCFEQKAHESDTSTRKRDSGAYFTPFWLSELLVRETINPLLDDVESVQDVLSIKVCDPASGGGAFALPIIDLLSRAVLARTNGDVTLSQARSLVIGNCLYCVDSDGLSVGFLKMLLATQLDSRDIDIKSLNRQVVCGDSVAGHIRHVDDAPTSIWAEHFSTILNDGGFSAIVGNPPWGAIKPSVREHFGALDGSLLRLQGQELRNRLRSDFIWQYRDWTDQSSQTRRYATTLRKCSGYQLQGPGDSEFYRFFFERAMELLHPQGRLGLVVPSSIRTAEGAAPLRRALFDRGTIDLLLDFVNSKRIFDIHGMFRFSVLTWAPGCRGGLRQSHFEITTRTQAEAAVTRQNRGIKFSRAYFAQTSPDRMTIPAVGSTSEARLFRRLHAAHPPLGEQLNDSWNVKFSRELDMTNQSHHFVTSTPKLMQSTENLGDGTLLHRDLDRLLPVYEGRMVQQFDPAAKGYLSGHGRSAKWEPLPLGTKRVAPHYYVPETSLDQFSDLHQFRAGFCDVTGHANERTVLSALIPAAAVCGNKVPTCRFDRDGTDYHFLWLALANSIVIDWIVRRRVGTTLNFFQWYQVPFPRLSIESLEGRTLVELAREAHTLTLSAPAGAYRRRAVVRAQMDSIIAECFDLDLHDLFTLFADFPLLDRGATAGFGSMTRDLVLLEYAKLNGSSDLRLSDLGIDPQSGPNSLLERTEIAEEAKAWAYVPAELRP